MRADRGFFAIGIFHPKRETNVGTVLRSATSFGAAFAYTVGARYERQASDTCASPRHMPLFNFASIDDLVSHLPHGCPLVGIELADGAAPLHAYEHRERACYLLGAEDHGLPADVLARCHDVVQIDGARFCLNVSAAGAIVMYDRTSRRAVRVVDPAAIEGEAGRKGEEESNG